MNRRALPAALALALLGAGAARAADAPFAIGAPLAGRAIFGCAGVTVQDGSTVRSEGVSSYVLKEGLAHVASNGDILVTSRATILGDATAGPGHLAKVAAGAYVTGFTTPAAGAVDCAPVDLSRLAALLASNDNAKIPKTAFGRSALKGAAGDALVLDAHDSVTLPAGTFLFSSIDLSQRAHVTVAGDARVLVTGNVRLTGNSFLNPAGGAFRLRLFVAGTRVSVETLSTVGAFVIAPSAEVFVGSESRVLGTIFAKFVTVREASAVIRLVDDTPPVLTLIEPAGANQPSLAAVRVRGFARDLETAVTSAKVNARAVSLQDDGSFDTTMDFTASSEVRVDAENAMGLVATVRVSLCSGPPTVAVLSPAGGSLVGSRIGTVSGTYRGAASVVVNGRTAVLEGGTFRLDGFDFGPDGVVVLAVVASNACAQSSVASVFTLDTAPPVVTIDTPAPGTILASSPVTVSGTFVEPNLAGITVNDAPAVISGNRFTAAAVGIPPGPSTLVAEARDRLGRVGVSAPVSVTLDTQSSAVVITSPVSGALTGDPTATVSGTASVPGLVSVRVAGRAAVVAGTTFIVPGVPLAEGDNRLVAEAIDSASRSFFSQPVFVTRDSLPPDVALDASSFPVLTKLLSINVSGTAADPHLGAVTVNGVPAVVAAGRFTAANVPLAEGANSVRAHAVDTLGHAVDSAAATVDRDTQAPAVVITSPAPEAQFAASGVIVTGTVVDAHLVDVTVNGMPATVTGGAFSASLSLGEGDTTLVASASDTLGNTGSSAGVPVTVDTLAPVVSIDAPADPLTGSAFVTVTGTVVEPHLVSLTVAGTPAVVSGGRFVATNVSLVEGTQQITSLAVDTFGHRAESAPVTYRLDSTPPVLTMSAPAPDFAACRRPGPPVTASGRVYGRGGVRPVVTLDALPAGGVAQSFTATVDAAGTTWTVPAVDLGSVDGTTTLTARTSDALGHDVRFLRTFRIKASSPSLSLLLDGRAMPGSAAGVAAAPGETPTLFGRALTPRASVSDGPGAAPPSSVVTLDGAPWAGSPISAEGTHLLAATATDCAGHAASAHALFTIDVTPPRLLSFVPADGATLGAAVASVSGTSDPDLASATVNGVAAAVTGGAFSVVPFSSREGTNPLSIVLVDPAGNRSAFSRSFNVKSLAPSVEILESGAPLGSGAHFFRAVTPSVRSNEPSATVTATLNGAPFVSGTPVGASGDYALAATATDTLGHSASASASFKVDLTSGPAVEITTPADRAILPGPTVVVTGIVSASVTSVSVNGRAATLTGTTWSLPDLVLPLDVPTEIVAIASDAAGRTASATRQVTVRASGPQILILEPADGAKTNRKKIDVAGAVVGGPSVTANGRVTVAGQSLALDTLGTFRAKDVALQSGANSITASATDPLGRTGTASVTVTTDTTAPGISLTADSQPLAEGESFARPFALRVTITDDTAPLPIPTIRLNGQDEGATAAVTDLPIAQAGGYVLSVIARDAAGNESRADRSFVLASGGCAVSALDPGDGAIVAAPKVTLKGRSGDAASVTITSAGQTFAAQLADGTFAAGDVPLAAVGDNTLSIACTDRAGAVSTASLKITRLADGAGPVVHIVQPVGGARQTGATVAVSGTVSDPAPAVTVNGVKAPVSSGVFSAGTLPLVEGPNVLAARAVDAAGRSGEDRVVVFRDSAAPKVTITSPPEGAHAGKAGSGPAAVNVSGLVDLTSEPNLASVVIATNVGSVTATVDSDTGAFYASSVPLATISPGAPQSVTVTATDTLGQSGTATVSVVFDPAAPALVLVEPVDGARFSETSPPSFAASGDVWAKDGAIVSINGGGLDGFTWDAPAADGRRHASFSAQVTVPAAEGPFGVIARVEEPSGAYANDKRLLFRDVTAPTVVDMRPADGAKQVDANEIPLVLFSETIRPSSLSAADGLTLTRVATGEKAVGTFTVAGSAVAFAPGTAMMRGEAYAFRAGTGITDLAGHALATAKEVRFTVAAIGAGAAPVLDTLPPVVCAPQLVVSGTAAPNAAVRVRDGSLSFTGNADAAGRFAVTIPLSGNGWHAVHAAVIGSGGSAGPEVAALFRVDCSTPAVVGATFDRGTGKVTLAFSEAMNAATLTVGGAGSAITVSKADDPANAPQPATLSLSTDGLTATLDLGSGASAWWANVSVRLSVGSPTADAAGNETAAPFSTVFFAGGGGDLSGGFLAGAALDDESGRPLAGADARLYASGAALPGSVLAGQVTPPTASTVTDGRGRFSLAGDIAAGRYALVLSRTGYTRAVRRLALEPAVGAVPFGSRLTPLAAQAPSLLAPASGGSFAGPTGSNATVEFATNALASASSLGVRLTPLSGQGLPEPLPFGWTPPAAAELRLIPNGTDDDALPEGAGTPFTAGGVTLTLPLPAGINQADLYAARYDVVAGAWLALPLPVFVAGSGSTPDRARVALAGPGSVAIVVPDADPATRPPAMPVSLDAPLVGVDAPVTPPALTATIALDPPIVSPTGRATARVVAKSSDGTARWPSGLAVQSYLDEKLILSGGAGELYEAPFSADLVLYHPPLSAGDLGSTAPGAAGALTFRISPSPRAAQVLLDTGYENVRLFPFTDQLERGQVLGPAGGSVTTADGVELFVPEGGLAQKTVVATRKLTAAELAALPPVAGYTTVAAVRIGLSGASLARPATLRLNAPGGLPIDAVDDPRYVLAAFVNRPDDGRGAFANAVSRVTLLPAAGAVPAKLVAAPEASGPTLPFPGVAEEGVFLFLHANAPVGFVTGRVTSPNGAGIAGSRVTAAGLGTANLSVPGGRYAVPAPAGAPTLNALHPVLGVAGSGQVPSLAKGQVATLDLVLSPVPPQIRALQPTNGAADQPVGSTVSIAFSSALDSASVTAARLFVSLADAVGAPTGLLFNGAVALSPDRTTVVFTPERPLPPSKRIAARFTGGVRDAAGTLYGGTLPVDWSFTTSTQFVTGGAIHPEKIKLLVPVNGVAQILGADGALPSVTGGTTPWSVWADVEGPVCPSKVTQPANVNGGFVLDAGCPPTVSVTIASKVYIHIIDPTGAEAATFKLGPFATPDGKGFVASPGDATVFTTSEGVEVTAPAAAFGVPTLVKVTKQPLDSLAVALNPGLEMGAVVNVDFDGIAKETLRLRIPVSTTSPVGGLVFAGTPIDLPWGRKLQILDVGRVVEDGKGGKLISTLEADQPDDPALVATTTTSSAMAGTGRQALAGRRPQALPKRLLQTIALEFTARATAGFVMGATLELAAITGHMEPALVGANFVVLYNALADAVVYRAIADNWSGNFILPIGGQAFTIVRRDIATGWITGQRDYQAISGDTKAFVNVKEFDGPSFTAPDLLDARPFSVARFVARSVKVPEACSALRLEIDACSTSGGTAKIRPTAVALAAESCVNLFNTTASTTLPQARVDTAGAWGVPALELAAKDGDQLLVVVSPGDVSPNGVTSFAFDFSRPLVESASPNTLAVLYDCGPVLTAHCTGAPTLPLTVEQTSGRRSLEITLLAQLPAGHRFLMRLLGLKADNTVPVPYRGPADFLFATRAAPPGPIVGTTGALPLGDAGTARDMLKIGNLLLVASASGRLVALDASSFLASAPTTPYALLNGVADQIRALATDGHNRVFYNALFGGSWAVKAVRVEDAREASAACSQPPWASGIPCFDAVPGGVKTAFAAGSVGTLSGSEYLTLVGSLPSGTPTAMDIAVEDKTTRALELADFYETNKTDGTPAFSTLVPGADGSFTFPVKLRSNVHPPPARTPICDEPGQDRYQRITVDNLSTAQSWSFDVTTPSWPGFQPNGLAAPGIRARRGDQLRIRYNIATQAYIAIVGSGISVVDLNRFYGTLTPTGAGATQGNKSECNRRLGKYEGGDIAFQPCPKNAGVPNFQGIALTPAIAVLGRTGVEPDPARGSALPDVYTPLTHYGFVHSAVSASPEGVGLQHIDDTCLVDSVAGVRSNLRDVAVAADVKWVKEWRGARPEEVLGDLLFVSLGAGGVAVYDVSSRNPSRIGRFAVPPNYLVFRVQADSKWGRLYTGGTDDLGKPVILVWDISRAEGDFGNDPDPRLLTTLHAAWDTNRIAIDESGTGLLYTWGNNGSGGQAVPVADPALVFVGRYRADAVAVPPGSVAVSSYRPADFLVPLGGPTRATASSEDANRSLDESRFTGAFRLRVALPGGLGPKLTIRVQGLRAIPDGHLLATDDVGALAAVPGGPGWPDAETYLTMVRLGTGCPSGSMTPECRGGSGKFSTAFNLYESAETVLLLSDPRARKAYTRQEVGGGETADEKNQCRRCALPSFVDPKDASVKELLAGGPYVRAHLAADPNGDPALQGATRAALDFFRDSYRAPAGVAKLTAWADEVPSPVQVSGAEPPLGAAMWGAEAGASVSLASGETILGTTDHAVRGRALGFSFDRTYRSGVIGYGPLGVAGWTSSLFAHLRQIPLVAEDKASEVLEYHDGSGRVYRFYYPNDATCPTGTHEPDQDGSYCAPKGVYLRLLKLKNGQGFRIVDPNHNWMRFDLNGRLVEIADRHRHAGAPNASEQGSQATLSYDGFGQMVAAEDELGRRYDFSYGTDPKAGDFGLLTGLKDFVGRTLTYNYDAGRKLVSVVLPAVKNKDDYAAFAYAAPTVTYTYKDFGLAPTAPLHGEFGPLKLQSFRIPGGQTERLTFDYAPASGRVSSLTLPATLQPWGLAFVPPANAAPVTRATLQAPWGLQTTYALDQGRTKTRSETVETLMDGDPTPPVGGLVTPKPIVTSFEYEADGRPRSVTAPDGTKTALSYAAGGDRLALTNPQSIRTDAGVAGTATYSFTEIGAITYHGDNILNGISDPLKRQITLAVPEAGASSKTTFAAEGVESTSTFEARGRLKDWKGTPAGAQPTPETTVEEFYPDAHNVPGDGFVKKVRSGSTTTDYAYDDAGNTKVAQSSNGPISTATHDAWDRPIEEIQNTSTKTYGVVTQRAWDEAGHVKRQRVLQDPLGWVETRYEYDDRERVTSVTRTHLANEDGTGFVEGATRYSYDSSTGLLDSIASPAGVSTAYRYDQAARVSSEKTGVSGARLKRYDALGRLVYTTDGHDGFWRGRYDGWGRLYKEELATNAIVEHEYDAAGGLVRETTLDGATVLAESKVHATSFGQVDLVTETLGSPPSGSPPGTPPITRVVKRVFDKTGRLTDEKSGPSEAEARNDVHYELDAASRVSSVTDAAGNATLYQYGAGADAPWPLSIERREMMPDGKTQSLVSTLERDAFGRVLKEARDDLVVTNTTYDQVGNVVEVASGAGTKVHHDYDGAGKLVRVARPGGRGSTTYGYDADGRIKLRRTTALGTTWDTSYTYDPTGRLTSIRRPDGTLEEFTEFYPDDTVKTYVSRQGVKIVNVYDAANRLKSRTPSGGPASLVLDGGDVYEYDAASRLTKAKRLSSAAATVNIGPYDLAGRPAMEEVGTRGPVRWAYDTWDRPTGTALPDGVGGDPATTVTSWQRRFDDLDRVLSVTPGLGSGLGAAWAWAGTGRVAGMTSNGPLHAATRFGYAVPSRLDSLAVGADSKADPKGSLGISWATLGYTYRPGDNAKTVRTVSDQTAKDGGRSLFANQGWNWDVDGGLRLKGAVSGGGSAAPAEPLESFRFDFGSGDEFLSQTREKDGKTVTLTPGVEGRVLARNGVAYTPPDGEGRRVADDRYDYQWTWRGELSSVTVKDCWAIENGESQDPDCPAGYTRPVYSGQQIRYEYDALGRLLSGTHLGPVPSGGGPRGFVEKREYLWDGKSLLAEAAYAIDGTIRWRKSYVPGAGGLDDASQLRVEAYDISGNATGAPRLFTYLRDELGTVLSLVEEKASVDPRSPPAPVRYLYNPLGEAHAEAGPEMRRISFESAITTVNGTSQIVPIPGETVAGALRVSLTSALDTATLATGVLIQRYETATGDWLDVLPGEFAVGLDPSDTTDLLVMRIAAWPKSERYRIRLTTGLKDVTQRPLVPPFGGTYFDVILDIPDDGTTAPPYDRSFPFVYDSVRAAGETGGGTFPGGQNCLFQGLWTDPVTGLSYARARWYSARDGVWLSQDPLGDKDSPNLYGFVGMRPHEKTDPLGLESVEQAIDRYAEDAFAGDSVTKKLLAGSLFFIKAGFDVVSVGATKKIDKAQEQLDRGEITQSQYWKKTTVAVAQTAATYAGGAGAGAVGARLGVRALGARGVTALGVRTAGAIGGASGGVGGQLAGDVVGIAAGEQEGLSSGETYLSAALVGGAIGAAGALPARTPRDVAVNPQAPGVRQLGRPIGRPSHNAALREEIERALAEGASDFRVNQQQITAASAESPGVRVGANRPDLQYTNSSGRRTFFEFDAPPATRAVPHAFRLLANDPSAIVYLRTLP